MAILFMACQNGPSEKIKILSDEDLDTIKTIRPVNLPEPALFETAFIQGTTEKVSDASVNFYGINIGKLKLPSGKIIACDPLHIDEYGIPYTQVFPTGEFPVQLSIVTIKSEEVIAFARIKFSEEPVVKWDMAMLSGQSSPAEKTVDANGFSVDASTGIYMDAQAVKGLDPHDIWEKESEHELFKEMAKHNHSDWRYTMYKFGSDNLAAFTTGFGDGRYASYIGYDAAGKPCRLLTDFGLFNSVKN